MQSLPRDSDFPYFIPADGEEFLAMKVSVTDLDYNQGEVGTEAAYSVMVGGEKVDVELVNSTESKLSHETTIVASVPKGSDAELVVTIAGLDQAISFKTGERTSKSAEAMYRHFSEVSLNQKYSGSVRIGGFSVAHSVDFVKAKVSGFHRERGWAPKDHAWLQLSWENNDGAIMPAHLYDVPTIDKAKTLQATDSEGKACSVSMGIPILDVTLAQGEVLIAVPVSAKQVNVIYSPHGKFVPSSFGATVPNLSPKSGNFTMKPIEFSIGIS